ncbi:hypothetical protein P7G51_09200 [Enterococcus asini]|uniref:hypothetical protein n=1 Tax=Enterococcus asini TaxID=57732 RepID=UPI00288E3395|nr:hypothetical protein [Enterococcus asini]MDT2757552.1 hypothetical protein [Enterococcus asini]
MKTKLITGAIIGATLFGGALSVSAAGVDNNVGTTDVGVAIVEPANGDEILTLKAVPKNYIFESLVTENNEYSLTATQIGDENGGNNQIIVHKNYSAVEKHEVRAEVSSLTLTRGKDNLGTVTVDNFTINEKAVLGTGNAKALYTDSEFAEGTQTTGDYTKAVSSATIGFTKADLKPADKLTGTITYTIGEFTPTTTTP